MIVIIIVVAIIVWMAYEFINAPFYDEKTKRFYKKTKK